MSRIISYLFSGWGHLLFLQRKNNLGQFPAPHGESQIAVQGFWHPLLASMATGHICSRHVCMQANSHMQNKRKSLFWIYLLIFMYIRVLPACVYEYHACAWCPQRPETFEPPGIIVTDGCEMPCGRWKPEQEQKVLLTIELSLQALKKKNTNLKKKLSVNQKTKTCLLSRIGSLHKLITYSLKN